MKRFLACLSVLSALTLPTAARADTYTNLDFYGYFAPGTYREVPFYSARIVLDSTTGVVVSVLRSYTNPNDLPSDYLFQWTGNGDYFVSAFFAPAGTSNHDNLELYLPVASLIGYAGGEVCSTLYPCADGGSFTVTVQDNYFYEGRLSTTPEPSSFILLGTGLVGLMGAVRRRFV